MNLIRSKIMKKVIAFMVTLAIFTACGTTAGSVGGNLTKEQRKELVAQEVTHRLNSRHYKIAVNFMTPLRGGGRRYVNGGYSLEVKGDTVRSYLPYFGNVYRATMGQQKALNFDAAIYNYEVKRSGKNAVQVFFFTETEEDRYQYQIDIYSNGRAYITVLAQNRDGITFDGDMELPP